MQLFESKARPNPRHDVLKKLAAGSRIARKDARCRLTNLPPTVLTFADTFSLLHALLKERALVIDGAMGTMVQAYKLTEEEFRGERFRDHAKPLKGNNDLLCITRPQVVEEM